MSQVFVVTSRARFTCGKHPGAADIWEFNETTSHTKTLTSLTELVDGRRRDSRASCCRRSRSTLVCGRWKDGDPYAINFGSRWEEVQILSHMMVHDCLAGASNSSLTSYKASSNSPASSITTS